MKLGERGNGVGGAVSRGGRVRGDSGGAFAYGFVAKGDSLSLCFRYTVALAMGLWQLIGGGAVVVTACN